MRRIPDSSAHAIAAGLQPRGLLGKVRFPEGAIVARFPVERGHDGRESTRGTTLTASAQVLTERKLDRKIRRVPAQQWQSEAWELRRETPEMRFMGDRQARGASQGRLFIAKRKKLEEEPIPVEDGPAADLAEMLFSDAPRVEQAAKRFAQHIIYNGESLILITQNEGALDWSPHSSTELTGTDAESFRLNDGSGSQTPIDPDRQVVVRSWIPDPELSALPDCPVRAVLPVARELIALTKYVSAQVDSRLAGSGLLLVPEDIESAMPKTGDEPDDYSFADELTDYMVVPIKDRDSAASVVPLIATVPAEYVDKVKHLTFDSPLDPHMHERRAEAIHRIALGMDSDPAVLEGAGGANHWSAWQIQEDEVRLGIAPILTTLCHALTQVVQPLLQQMGVADADKHMVWFNTDALDIRPDRSKDSQVLNERGIVSDEATRRETGFTDADAPKADERKKWLAERLLLADPKLAPVLADIAGLPGVDWDKVQDAESAVPGGAPALAAPAVEAKPDTGPPATRDDPPPAAKGITAAADLDDHSEDGMIALLPTADDAQRLAVGDTDPRELHLTLAYLPDVGGYDDRETLAGLVAGVGPISGEVNGTAHLGERAQVWLVNAPGLTDLRGRVVDQLDNDPDVPDRSTDFDGFIPHVTHTTGMSTPASPELEAAKGPVTFDRVRVALRGRYLDVPLEGGVES